MTITRLILCGAVLFAALFFFLADARCQVDFPLPISVVSTAAPGYYLFEIPVRDSAVFIDHAGFPRKSWLSHDGRTPKLQPDGSITLYSTDNYYTLYAPNGDSLARLSAEPYTTDFHDVTLLSNGRYLVLGRNERTVDLSLEIEGASTSAQVQEAVILEKDLGGNTHFEWKSLDHLPTSQSALSIDLLRNNRVNYFHANSVMLDHDGHVLVSSRNLCEIIKINRTTGAVIWRLGGSSSKGNMFRWLNDTIAGFVGFSQQHSISRMANGDYLLFDNGNHRQRPFSRVIALRLDEVAMTVERTWQFVHPDSVFAETMGSAVELQGGGILIGWGNNRQDYIFTEITREGEVAAEMRSTNRIASTYRIDKATHPVSFFAGTLSTPAAYQSLADVGIAARLGGDINSLRVVAERHEDSRSFGVPPSPLPCRIAPVRWTVRADVSVVPSGGMRFSRSILPSNIDAREVFVYHRPIEGAGTWRKLPGRWLQSNSSFEVDTFRAGEFIAGVSECLVPELRRPVIGSRRIVQPVTFEWSEALNQRGYRLQVSLSPSFSSQELVVDTTVNSTYLQISNMLLGGRVHYWRVSSRGETSDGTWSSVASFYPELTAPNNLKPNLPASATRTEPWPVEFSWSDNSPDSQFEVAIWPGLDTSRPLSEAIVYTTSQQELYNVPFVRPLSSYVWSVRTMSRGDTSMWSSRASFTSSVASPARLYPESPVAHISSKSVVAYWSPVGGAIGYLFRCIDSIGGTIYEDQLLSETLVLPPMAYSGTVRFVVQAFDDNGFSRPKTSSTMELVGTKESSQPILVRPWNSDTLEHESPQFWWHVPEQGSYNFVLASDSLLLDVVHTTRLSDTFYSLVNLPTLPYSRYYWTVLLNREGGTGSPSEVRSVYYAPKSRVRPMRAVSPVQGATQVPIQGNVRFHSDSRCDEYRLQMYDSSGARVYINTSQDTAIGYAGLRQSSVYYWHIIGEFQTSIVDTSSLYSFRTFDPTVSIEEQPSLTNGITVSVEAGFVLVHGLSPKTNLRVYDVVGREYANSSSDLNSARIAVPRGAAYIIMQNEAEVHSVIVYVP